MNRVKGELMRPDGVDRAVWDGYWTGQLVQKTGIKIPFPLVSGIPVPSAVAIKGWSVRNTALGDWMQSQFAQRHMQLALVDEAQGRVPERTSAELLQLARTAAMGTDLLNLQPLIQSLETIKVKALADYENHSVIQLEGDIQQRQHLIAELQRTLRQTEEEVARIQNQIAVAQAYAAAERQKLSVARELQYSIITEREDALRVLHGDDADMAEHKRRLFEHSTEFVLQSTANGCIRLVLDSFEKGEEKGMWPGFRALAKQHKWDVSLTRDDTSMQIESPQSQGRAYAPMSHLLVKGLMDEVFKRLDQNDESWFKGMQQAATERRYTLTAYAAFSGQNDLEKRMLADLLRRPK